MPRDVAAQGAARAAADGRRLIERGDSLWELARRNYGRGTDFEAIYQANRDQIRNPDLIYPGQVFVIPPSR
jgi:nucleoid-associated protein YgaU